MNNIKTDEDIRKWAEDIVAAKGERFTPLSKADLFAIANYIVGASCASYSSPQSAPPEKKTEDAQPQKKPEQTRADAENTTKATMTRGYALQRAGFTVQQAYDRFLEWGKEHPKEASVMDFSSGVKSNNAAFAYWLQAIITVDVPNNLMGK